SEYVRFAVQSAVQQTYGLKEIIVVDDGSDEETKRVLKELESDIDLLITQRNSGTSAARNNGIKRASGDFILVLDSDDSFEPDFSEKAIKCFHDFSNIRLVTCYARWFNKKGMSRIYKPAGGTIKDYLISNAAMGSALFLKKDWEEVGGYDEK